MNFAHAGHNHMEEHVNPSIDPLIVIVLAAVVTVLFVVGLIITLNRLAKHKKQAKPRE